MNSPPFALSPEALQPFGVAVARLAAELAAGMVAAHLRAVAPPTHATAKHNPLGSPRAFLDALGSTAAQHLLGTTVGITELRGRWLFRRGVPVMPTYHPAYLLRAPAMKADAWADLQAVAKRMCREGGPST